MYLTRLHVKNLKRVRELEVDFTEGGKPRMWTVLIGENGTAKTSLLQAIALAAAGSAEVNGLAATVVQHLRDRRHDHTLQIDADFTFPSGAWTSSTHPLAPSTHLSRIELHSTLSLVPGSTSIEGSACYVDPMGICVSSDKQDPLKHARAFHTPRWFVAGYGVSRLLPDASALPSLARPSIDRLEPLMKHTAALASTSFANHFLAKDVKQGLPRGNTSRTYGKILNQAIKLGGEDLLPDIDKIELRGSGGAKTSADLIESDRIRQRMGAKTYRMPGVALSHGYQSTFAWIADLIGHVLLESQTELSTTEMEGVVLLDEIDLYLHPGWQATFITGLRKVFPHMQFIATTHSPVVLADLRPTEILRLQADPDTGDVRDAPQAADPRPMTGSEIYRQWFGVDRLTPNPHGSSLREYMVLAGDPYRTAEDETRLARLKKQLAEAGIDHIMAPVSRREGRVAE